jgi:hypothetical protein
MKLICIALILTFASSDGQQKSNGQNGAEIPPFIPRLIGPEHREIGDGSPFSQLVLASAIPDPQSRENFAVRATLHNLTDHELTFVDVGGAFDVRAGTSGKLAPETAFGCSIDFFSECHTTRKRPPWSAIVLHVPEHGSLDLGVSYLDPEYILEPGSYTVVEYFCAKQREGPECLKSNAITIDVPSK